MSAEPTPSAEEEPPRPTRADVIATLVIVAAAAGIIAATPVVRRLARHPTREQCAAMLERYAEQQARAANLAPTADPAAQSGAEPAEVDRCVADLTADEVDCALHATYVDALERCLP